MNPFDPFSLFSASLKQFTSAVSEPEAFIRRAEASARNAAEWIGNGGGLSVDEPYSPYAVMAQGTNFRLRRYFPDNPATTAPPILFVPPLMIKADVYDIAERSSPVRAAHDNGLDVWVIDFGSPEEEPGGLKRSVADHVLAVSEAVEAMHRETGRNVVLSGYSQGGLFSYLTAAYRRNAGVEAIVTYGSVVDFQTGAPLPIPMSPENYEEFAQLVLDSGIFRHASLPAWANRGITKLIDPVRTAEYYVTYFQQMHDRDQILRNEKQRRFLDQDGWAAYPGPAMNDLMEYVAHNRLLAGGIAIGDKVVALSDIEVPILIAVGERDPQGPPAGARAIARAAPLACVHELTLDTGHFGIIASSAARKWTWPRVAGWIRWCAGQGPFPDVLVPVAEVTSTRSWQPDASARQVQQFVDLGWELSRATFRTLSDGFSLWSAAFREGAQHQPLKAVAERWKPEVDKSLARLLDEAAERDPEAPAIFFEDRVIRRGAFKSGIDRLVARLIGAGVREGSHVGIALASPLAAFGLLAAVNRIGAVAVMHRPNADLSHEARLAGISHLVCDAARVLPAKQLPGVKQCLLDRPEPDECLPGPVHNLVGDDAEEVALPAWYRANPDRGSEAALILFDEEGQPLAVSQQEWARAGAGLAEATGLKASDTVFVAAPLHLRATLFGAIAPALAAGCRLGLPGAGDAAPFWAEARRYGASVIGFAGLSLHALLDAAPQALETDSPVRLFLGSGMPTYLHERLSTRFPEATIATFHATRAGGALLADPEGAKPGAAGRAVTGASDVRLVGCTAEGSVLTGDTGLAAVVPPGATGILICRAPADAGDADDLRGLFAPGDRWRSTGELFTRDEEGDLWQQPRPGKASTVSDIDRARSREQLRDAIASCDKIALAATLERHSDDGVEIMGFATLGEGAVYTARDLVRSLARLPSGQWPSCLFLIAAMPLTDDMTIDDACLLDMAGSPGGRVIRRSANGRGYHMSAKARR